MSFYGSDKAREARRRALRSELLSLGASPGILAFRLAGLLEVASIGGGKVAVLHLEAAPGEDPAQRDVLLADRIAAAMPQFGLAMRLGADGFAVGVLLDDKAQIIAFVDALTRDLAQQARTRAIACGLALWPEDGTVAPALLERAARAATRARQQDVGWKRLEGSELAADPHELRDALAGRRVQVRYATTSSDQTGSIAGFRASLRWPRGRGDPLRQAELDRLAGSGPLGAELLAYLLHMATRAAATWPENLGLTVTLTPAQQQVPGLADILRQALEQAGLAPHRLLLDMEGAPVESVALLRGLGIGVHAPHLAPSRSEAPSQHGTPGMDAAGPRAARDSLVVELEGLLRLGATLAAAPSAAIVADTGERRVALQLRHAPGIPELGTAELRALAGLLGVSGTLVIDDGAPAWRQAALSRTSGAVALRCFAGASILDAEGAMMGTLFVLDTAARIVSPDVAAALRTLAVAAANAIGVRRLRQPEVRVGLPAGEADLPGPRALLDAVARAIAQQRRGGQHFSMLLVALDPAADPAAGLLDAEREAVIRQEVAATLKACLRTEDVPARLGAGHFGAVLVAGDGAEAALVAERVRAAAHERFAALGVPANLSVAGAYFVTPPLSATDALDFVGDLLARTPAGGVLAGTHAAMPPNSAMSSAEELARS